MLADERERRRDHKNKSEREKSERIQKTFKDRIQEANTKIMWSRLLTSVVVSVSMIGMYQLMSSSFDGVVVARLPFEPYSFFHGISHRNIPGGDYRECSMVRRGPAPARAVTARLCAVARRPSVPPPRPAPCPMQSLIYAISSMGIRSIIAKAFGHKGPKSPGGGGSDMFGMAEAMTQNMVNSK